MTRTPTSSADRRGGQRPPATSAVDLLWIPLGAGASLPTVRVSGWVYEAIAAAREHRRRLALYHAAMEVRLGNDVHVLEKGRGRMFRAGPSTNANDSNGVIGSTYTAFFPHSDLVDHAVVGPGRADDRGPDVRCAATDTMTPAWGPAHQPGAAVTGGAVGARVLGRSRLFRYEVHCSTRATIPDREHAVRTVHVAEGDDALARRVVDLAPYVPGSTWGRDEARTGEMWNSNSVVAWLLARAGADLSTVSPPHGGRAPGWDAGLVVAESPASLR